MLLTFQSTDHLVNKIIDIQEFQFHRRVVDLDRKVVGNVVAEGGYSRIVVGPAPFPEKVGEPVDQDPCPGLRGIAEEQILACLFAAAVFAVAETAGQGGLRRGREHYGTPVAVLLKGVQKGGCEAEVALHEVLLVLRPVHSGQVEHEVTVAAPHVKLLRCRVKVVLIYVVDLEIIVASGLAFPYVVELRTKVLADESFCAGDKYFHYDLSVCFSDSRMSLSRWLLL